jgi:glycerol-3-phosphate acyltransferase PlsX
MGNVYAQYLYRRERPRVGLLSVGGEDIKGNDLTKETFKRLEQLPINFIGNVEADAAFEGGVDVVVSDGFAGNVMLKGAEGLARATVHWLKKVMTKNAVRLMGAVLAKNAFVELKSFGASDVIGGAPLLGINGICIIGHGGSNPTAVRNAIRVSAECVKFGLNQRIVNAIEAAGDVAKLQKFPPENAANQQ